MLRVDLCEGLPMPQTGIMKKEKFDKYLDLDDIHEAVRILGLRKVKERMLQLDREREAALDQAYRDGFALFSRPRQSSRKHQRQQQMRCSV